MGTIKSMREKWSGSNAVRLFVIIGLDDDKDALNRMAEEVGGDIYFDPDGAVIRKLGGSGVPHWFVLDSGNKIIRHFGGSYSSLDEHLNQLGF